MSRHIPKITIIESLPGEEWREIPGYDGAYEVSNLGRVATHVAGRFRSVNRIMNPGLKGNGYLKVSLGGRSAHKNHYIHRLVLQAFCPDSNGKPDVNHKDGNKLNNRLENLEWVSRSENMQHAMRIGLWSSVGTNNPQAILTPSNVKAIRQYLSEGKRYAELAKLFGVCRGVIGNINNGKSWRHVA